MSENERQHAPEAPYSSSSPGDADSWNRTLASATLLGYADLAVFFRPGSALRRSRSSCGIGILHSSRAQLAAFATAAGAVPAATRYLFLALYVLLQSRTTAGLSGQSLGWVRSAFRRRHALFCTASLLAFAWRLLGIALLHTPDIADAHERLLSDRSRMLLIADVRQ